MSKDWLTQTASDLGRGIEAGEISPVALTQTYLDAIKTHPLAHRIYTITTEKRALAEAEAALIRANNGTRRSPLDGVPISWKDLFDTVGTATEAGSKLLAGRIPDADALVLENANNAGLICLGKTHMSELAFSGLGLNPMTQTTPCVNDLDAVSGGSSSGAAGSVAFGLAAAGIGSDTGGSVRIPAAWNDLVGLKTTSGQLSLKGVVPLCKKFDTVGPLCRSVEDAHALYFIMKGEPVKPLKPKKPTRVMRLTTAAMDDMDDAVKTSFNAATQAMRDDGTDIVDVEFPLIGDVLALSGVIFTTEAYAEWGQVLEVEGDKMYPEILARFMSGKTHSTDSYDKAWGFLNVARRQWNELVSEYDAVILPSGPIMPPNIDRLLNDSEYYKRANLLALRNTRIGNMLDLCVVTLPTKTPSCGVLIMGLPNTEDTLLQTSAAIEAIL